MSRSEPTEARDRSRTLHPLALVLLGLIVVVPMAVLVVHALGLHYHASSDLALIELRVRDIGTAHSPLVGPYSRFNWNHPGPLLFATLALPYRAFGADGPALLGASALVNGLFLVGATLLLWRRGGVAGAALGLVVLMALTRALGGEVLQSAWNPYMIVMPSLVLVLVLWCIACGDAFLLPVAVGVASWVVQTHLGTAPLAAVAIVVATAVIGVAATRGRVLRPVRLALVAIAVGVVMWIPPIIDATHAHGGNLGALWRYWSASHPDVTGWSRAARIVGAQLAIPAPWMAGPEQLNPFGGGGLDPSWRVPWTLLLLGVAVVVARRRRDQPAWSLGLVALGLAVVAWVATAQVVGEPYPYVVLWTWLVGAVAWLAIGWTCMGVLRSAGTAPAIRRIGFVVCALSAMVLATAATADTIGAPLVSDAGQLVGGVQAATVAAARRLPSPILVESAPSFDSGSVTTGILLALDHAGLRAGRTRQYEWQVGAGHVVTRAQARSRVVVAVNKEIERYDHDAHYEVIAAYDQLSRRDRAFAERTRAAIPTTGGLAAVQRWTGRHPRLWKRFTGLEKRGDRAVVYRFRDVAR
ncbi:MAG: hypothetical protein ABJC79_12865 [Acidimicrobiia bacterium]